MNNMIICPKCGKKIKVRTFFATSYVKCKKCNYKIILSKWVFVIRCIVYGIGGVLSAYLLELNWFKNLHFNIVINTMLKLVLVALIFVTLSLLADLIYYMFCKIHTKP
jgi:DNA-directed RNA polymerase subunit RPC12/RpoP